MSTDGEGLFVSEAFHEARIEVTEEGTKAASATGMWHFALKGVKVAPKVAQWSYPKYQHSK